MFTGIIGQTGIVRRFVRSGPSYRLEVESSGMPKDIMIGDSVAVDGVCLTVLEKSEKSMGFEVMEETAKRSTLLELKAGDAVNIELSLKVNGTIGGHFVQGHVDCVGRITAVKKDNSESFIEIEFPTGFERLIVEKGSVAIDGISLTIGGISGRRFKVYVISHTFKFTGLGSKRAGDKVNLEFDILGKYMARFEELKSGGRVTEKLLKDNGF